MVKSELASRGVASDFRILSLDFTGAEIAAIRLGPEASPDVSVGAAALTLGWTGFSPSITALRLAEPQLRVRLDPDGRLSLGSLDSALAGSGARAQRPTLPEMRLEIKDGQALIEGPFGAVTASMNADGVLGRDFSALARIDPVTRSNADYALNNAAATLRIESPQGGLHLRLQAQADGVAWEGAEISGLALNLEARAPRDLSRADLNGAWRINAARMPQALAADGVTGVIRLDGEMREDALTPTSWRGDARIEAARLAAERDELLGVRATADIVTDDGAGAGSWALAAARLDGFGLVTPNAAAQGDLRFDANGPTRLALRGAASLRDAALSANAQQTLRSILPDLPGSPVGPAFAQAEQALDTAVDRFDLNVPISFELTEEIARLLSPGPATLRAASGMVATIAPIRADDPAMVLQFPGPSLAGAVALDLAGGGAPRLTLLLDSMAWSAGQAFETEGTLSVHDWRAGGASIAANDLVVRFAMQPQGAGRLELVGPARINGPVGDGQVRDLIPQLDVSVAWGDGWRIAPNGCLPMSLGQLDVAGLSFAGGALSLCAGADGALVAADGSGRMSGGFSISDLRLDGALSGPNPPPARLRAANVTGRFAGTTDQTQVLITATAPALAVDLDANRTMLVQGEALTANARVGGGEWSVTGAFRAGAFEEPSSPGVVSAIAGAWSAAPEADQVVLRVEAGEAYVQARPADEGVDDTRPLFNPVRLTNVEALMRDGSIRAEGEVVLDAGGRALATFNASHDLESGQGEAHLIADELMFDENLQPYEISELARGLIENVRGSADASADAAWSREAFSLTGTVRPNGLSLAMATIPLIENVRGEVYFDDLVNLTTPPGQRIEVGALNPGVEVRNGRIEFQLLPEQRVAIERAAFEFAGGELAVAPTTIELGAEETRFNLTLADVDVAALIAQLNMPDLQATGRVEGAFPIRLTERTAFIEDGQLRAAPGGGTISYVGSAGDGVTGAARVAFDALRSFRYDNLSLDLNGDLNGEVVSRINFSGENTGRPVDLTPIAGSPIGAVNARGVPFAFRVQVSAPFRQLARTAASITNPGDMLNAAQGQNSDAEAVDSSTSTAPSVDVQVEPLN